MWPEIGSSKQRLARPASISFYSTAVMQHILYLPCVPMGGKVTGFSGAANAVPFASQPWLRPCAASRQDAILLNPGFARRCATSAQQARVGPFLSRPDADTKQNGVPRVPAFGFPSIHEWTSEEFLGGLGQDYFPVFFVQSKRGQYFPKLPIIVRAKNAAHQKRLEAMAG